MRLVLLAGLASLLLTSCGGGSPGGGAHEFDFGAPADGSAADRTIEVEATDTLEFGPPQVDVEVGDVVTFVIENTGSIEHEFNLAPEAEQEQIASGDGHMHHGPNHVHLQPGETGELTWRFTESGSVQYACHVDGHYKGGMFGTVRVSG